VIGALLLTGFVTFINYINSVKLSANSRASEPKKYFPVLKPTVTNWVFSAVFCNCLEFTRTPALPSPGQIKIIRNNRPYETITPGVSGDDYSLHLNNDPNIQRVSIEGTVDDVFTIPPNVDWQYCNDPQKNPVSSLGTYWLVHTSDTCPLLTDPTPTPELFPDLSIESIVTSTQAPSLYTITVTVKNSGQVSARNFYLDGYIDPTEYPPTLATISKFQTYLGANLSPGGTFSYSKTYPLVDGIHKIFAWVDSNDEVLESNEKNNTKGCSATVANGTISLCNNKVYMPVVQTPGNIIITAPAPLSGKKN